MEFEALSNKDHRELLANFLSWSQKKRGETIRELEAQFRDVKATRLLDETFLKAEVSKIIDELLVLARSSVQTDAVAVSRIAADILKSAASEAEKLGAAISFDFSSVDDMASVSRAVRYESALGIGGGSASSSLPSLSSGGLAPLGGLGAKKGLAAPLEGGNRSLSDVITLKNENAELKDRLAKIQGQFNTMMQDKTALSDSVNGLKDQLAESQLSVSDLEKRVAQLQQTAVKSAASAEAQGAEAQAAISSAAQEEIAKKDSEIEKLRSQLVSLSQKTASSASSSKDLESRIEMLEHDLASSRAQLSKKMEELESNQKEQQRKITDTQQFKSMKKMLASKNQQVKELRDRLQKWEPLSSADAEDTESSDDD